MANTQFYKQETCRDTFPVYYTAGSWWVKNVPLIFVHPPKELLPCLTGDLQRLLAWNGDYSAVNEIDQHLPSTAYP